MQTTSSHALPTKPKQASGYWPHANKLISIVSSILTIVGVTVAIYTYKDSKNVADEISHLEIINTQLYSKLSSIDGKMPIISDVKGTKSVYLKYKPTINPNSHKERLKINALYQSTFYESERLFYENNYKIFILKYALTQDQVACLTDALLQRAIDFDDIEIGSKTQNIDTEDPAVLELKAHVEEKFNSLLLKLLGQELYKQFGNYDRQSNIRLTIGRYGAGLSLIGAPISLDQSDLLAEAIANTSPTYLNGGKVNTKEIDWNVVDEKAKQILTSEQFEFFKNTNPMGGQVSRWAQKFDNAIDDIINRSKQNDVSKSLK